MSPYCLIGNPPRPLILTSFRDSTDDTCSRKRQPPTFDPRIGGQTCLWSTQLYLFVLARNLAQVPMCQVGNISHKNGAYDAPGCPCRKNVESGIWDVWYTACFICNTGSNFHPCHPLFRTKPAFMPTMGTSRRPLHSQWSSIHCSNLPQKLFSSSISENSRKISSTRKYGFLHFCHRCHLWSKQLISSLKAPWSGLDEREN